MQSPPPPSMSHVWPNLPSLPYLFHHPEWTNGSGSGWQHPCGYPLERVGRIENWLGQDLSSIRLLADANSYGGESLKSWIALTGGGAGLRSLVSTCVQLSIGRMTNTEYMQKQIDERKCTVLYSTFARVAVFVPCGRFSARSNSNHTAGWSTSLQS